MRARRARRLIRRPAVQVAAAVVVFAVALALWTSGLSGSGAVVVPPTTGGVLGSRVAEGPQPATASGSATTGASPGSSNGPLPGLPPDTIHTFAPGLHLVVANATSTTGKIGAVAYIFAAHGPRRTVYDVRSPLRVSFRVAGQNNFVAMGLQVGPDGGSATCSVTVDGQLIVRYTANGANRVVQCIV